mgnify:CR=1 FL=1
MPTRYLNLFRIVLVFTDFLLLNLSFFIAFYIAHQLQKSFPFHYYQNFLLNINLFWLISSNMIRLYSESSLSILEEIFRASWKSIGLHSVFLMLYVITNHDIIISNHLLFLFYFILSICFLASRFTCTLLDPILKRRYKASKKVAVMGRNEVGLRLATYFETNQSNYKFEGYLNNGNSLFVDDAGKLLPGTCEQIKQAAAKGIHDIFISLTPERLVEAPFLLREAEKQCVRLKFVPDFTESLISPFEIKYMESFPIISLRPEPLENANNAFKKRVFDILFSGFVILFILTWLFPILAILIKLESRGPVFFKQLRSGRNNKNFWCYKFRSMKVNSESDTRQASKEDDRITIIGRFLRKTNLDEFPQFFNVLLGNMSIIGPRPHMIKHTEQYRAIIDRYMVRHYLKPGITGWAQVNGFRGETHTNELMESRVNHDIWYFENWSLMLDIKIVFQTIINMFSGDKNAF